MAATLKRAGLVLYRAASEIAGSIPLAGFTAPKLLWVKKHEPHIFAEVVKVLLPKDYVRLRMTGDYASDMESSAYLP